MHVLPSTYRADLMTCCSNAAWQHLPMHIPANGCCDVWQLQQLPWRALQRQWCSSIHVPNQQSIRRAQGSCRVQLLQGGHPHLPIGCKLKLAEAGCRVAVQQQACTCVPEAAADTSKSACHGTKGGPECWAHTEMCMSGKQGYVHGANWPACWRIQRAFPGKLMHGAAYIMANCW